MVNLGSSVFVSIVLLVVTQSSSALAKEHRPGWYPPEMAKLTSKDWPEMRKRLEAAALNKEATNPQAIDDAIFTVTRIGAISWPAQSKQEVCEFLANYLKDVLCSMKLVSHQTGMNTIADRYKKLASASVRACLATDLDAGMKTIRDVWKDLLTEPKDERLAHIRIAALGDLLNQFRDDRVEKFVRELQASVSYETSPGEKNIFYSFALRRALFALSDQRKAWKYLWDASPKGSLASVMTQERRSLWYENSKTMTLVYPDSSPEATLQLAAETGDLAERYVFLFVTCLLTNYQGKNVDTAFRQKLLRSINDFQLLMEQDNSYKSSPRNYDYLRDIEQRIKAALTANKSEK